MDTNPSLIGFIQLVSQLFSISEVEAAFWVGGVFFTVFFGVVGRIVFKMGVWGKARGAPYEPMQAFTTKTPMQVVKEGQAASMKLLLTWLMFILVIVSVGLIWIINQYGEAQTIGQTIGNLLRSFLSH